MNTKKYVSLILGLAVVGSLALAVSVSAQGNPQGTTGGKFGRGMMNRGGVPAVIGTVSAVSGNTITVSGKQGFNSTTTNTTYNVDATNAKVTKNNTASTVAGIAVGDTVLVQGTVSGSNITATNIRDGVMMRKPGGVGQNQGQPQITGNGQPVVAGSVTAVSGNTITTTNKSNVVYTIDATNAKLIVRGVTSPTISNVAVGDNVVVQGTVNGNSVVASSVIDQKIPANGGENNNGNNSKPQGGFMGGMMGGITNFFKHMFGF